MASDASDLLVRYPWVKRRPLTVAEYHRMGEAGILTEDDRVELVEGQLVAMSPIGSQDSGTINTLNRSLVVTIGDRAVVAVQNPVQLDDLSEPQPDFAVLRPKADDYWEATPRSEDVLVIVGVADSSLAYDRDVKRAPYTRHGIPEFWIVNLIGRQVEVCRHPVHGGYTSITQAGPDAVLEPELLPGVRIPVATLMR